MLSNAASASSPNKRALAHSNEVPKWCQQVEFTEWSSLTPQKARAVFANKSKIELNQMLWAEILKERPSTEVILLINFLANYQATENEHSYYTLMASAINLKMPIYEVMDNWEKNKHQIKLNRINTTLSVLCSTYEKTIKE